MNTKKICNLTFAIAFWGFPAMAAEDGSEVKGRFNVTAQVQESVELRVVQAPRGIVIPQVKATQGSAPVAVMSNEDGNSWSKFVSTLSIQDVKNAFLLTIAF